MTSVCVPGSMAAGLRLRVLGSHAASLPAARSEPVLWPRYLRVVVSAQCPLACAFCHREGDPAKPGMARGLPADDLVELSSIGIELGVDKLKLLGGEPLLRRDLPEVVRKLRARAPGVDLSVITAGVVPVDRIDRLFEAGLSRCNVSIHGFSERAFAARGQRPALFEARERFLAAVLAHGRPTKLNYVYTGTDDESDLGALLAWAAERDVVVNVLDDLSKPDLGPEVLIAAVTRLRSMPAWVRVEDDPASLPTLRLCFADGLEVEIKHERLGARAPWTSCDGCRVRSRCREGIHALRLGHVGVLRPCMDRPDLGVNVRSAFHVGGRDAAKATWASYVGAWAR